MANPRGAPIVILGMHRAGTSIVTNLLHRVGISMGDDFLPPDGFNPNGYFEDTDFLWINKGILENAEGIWYDPPSIDEIIVGGEKFKSAIRKTVARKRQKAGQNSWGWKDPRNCLTCWNYAHEVPDARFIVVVRNLSDIKLSLNRTHGHLANWDNVIDAYYDSVDEFFGTCINSSLNVGFEELVYEKYARETIRKILYFVDKPDRFIDKALSVIRFR